MPCGCGLHDPPQSKGHVVTSWLSREGGRTVRVAKKLKRVTCRCGKSWTEGLPALADGYRATESVVSAIFERSIDASFVDTAREHGTNRTTVSKIYAERAEPILANVARAPTPLALRAQRVGDRTFILACDGEVPGIVEAFTGFRDPRLVAFLRLAGCRIHADWTVGSQLLARLPDAKLTIHRSAFFERLLEALPDCVTILRRSLDRSDRTVLAGIEDALCKPPLGVSLREASAIKEAGRLVPAIRRFASATEGLAATFQNRERGTAERAHDAWRGRHASEFMRPVDRIVSSMEEAVFNAGYGEIPTRTWEGVVALALDVRGNEPMVKPVVRHLIEGMKRTRNLEAKPSWQARDRPTWFR